jgi:hypothetical protein
VYGRGQAGRARVTGESMGEEDMVMRVGSSLSTERRRTDEEGRAASPRDIRRCQMIPYTYLPTNSN